MQPQVSFVIPCYNYGRFLRDCLQGIAAQDAGVEHEVIAVNDGSTDNTAALLREAAAADRRIRVVDRAVNLGHVATVNEGLALARGRYVVRVDPDDRHHSNFLRVTLPLLESRPQLALVHGNFNLINEQGEVTARAAQAWGGKGRDCGNEFLALLKCNHICAPTVVARREAWMSAWPVPEGLAFNDWWFNLQLASRWDFGYVDEVVADYRVHANNHHTRISRDGSEERSVLALLGMIFSRREDRPELQGAKMSAQDSVYAAQYLDFARKHFGHGMHGEARRCFLQAWRHHPRSLLDARILRWWMASFLTPPQWRRLKALLGRRIEA